MPGSANPAAAPHVRVGVMAPDPLVAVTLDRDGRTDPDTGADTIRVEAAGQGVWVSDSVTVLGARPLLYGLVPDQQRGMLEALLAERGIELRAAAGPGPLGCYVTDRRSQPEQLLASAWAPPPDEAAVEELCDLVESTLPEINVLVVCNPLPGDALPVEVYPRLISSAQAADVPVVVDLSSPRLDAALPARPTLVKVNDWEVAEFAIGPVQGAAALAGVVQRLRDRGALSVVVTSGAGTVYAAPADAAAVQLVPPAVAHGHPAGCGDAMTGAMAAALGAGRPWLDSVVLGMAAGAAHFAVGGAGVPTRDQVEAMVGEVTQEAG